MNYFVKFLLILVILTTLGNLVSQVILWVPPVSDNDSAIGGGEKKPEISVNISTAVTPDASGKVPTGGVNISGNTASVVVPEGVQLAEGATELTFSVESISEPNEDVPVAEGETATSIDVHIDGVAEDNNVPMLVTIKKLFSKGLNTTSVKMYHVENGAPVEMALVSDPANHNEFSYDPATGDVVMCVASFSEYVTVEKDLNLWEGGYDYSWYEGKSSPYTISTAEQLAGLGAIVDGGYTKPDGTTVTLTADDFAGKTILLGADIDLYGTDESGNRLSFNPIGFKYPGAKDDEGNDISKIFRGTFDGQNHTIKNLYQNGWAMGLSYSNAGGGLFAGIYNATIKNLTMKGADIVMEAVPMGTVAAYAYGNCTFDHIRITQSTLQNYNWDIAAIVGGVNGTHTFSDIHIDNTVTLSSLWGSFGGGIGGVIGSVYGGNNGNNSVTMKNVDVACVLDVYNDVTSAYQWYAYRFCGMLIGNTNEPGADGKNAYIAQASFLNCVKDENGNDTVRVYYGDWVNYHYCKFTNQSNESGSVNWQNNYPWVRVEEGLSNPGYSNARYGHPIVDGVAVTAENHVHRENDGDCNLLIEFNQLYGGDQGVYGAETHPGVSEAIYTVTYMDHGEVLHVDYVTDNTKAYDCEHVDGTGVWPITNVKDANNNNNNNNSPSYWVKGDNSKFEGVGSGNTANVIVYPKWPNEYTIRCLDTYGDVAYYNFVTDDNTTDAQYQAIADEINNTLKTIQNEVDKDQKVIIIVWEKADGSTTTSVTANEIKNVVNSGNDFILKAIPKLQNTSITLKPYNDPTTGELVSYYVAEVAQNDANTSVVIPGYVGTVPVTVISDGAAEGFAKLHATTIPGTIENIGNNAFASTPKPSLISNGKFETQTFYYDGDPTKFNEQLQKHLENGESEMFSRLWDSGLGKGSRIFFLKEGKVDPDAGYWELTEVQIEKGGNFFNPTLKSEEYVWTYYASVRDKETAFTNEYTGNCDCGCGKRPDEAYWLGAFDEEQ